MKFRTEYIPSPADRPLDPEQPVVLLGSCFTRSIGEKMQQSLWRAWVNPTGVLYNPLSIARVLEAAIADDYSTSRIVEDSLVSSSEMWVSWLADSTATTGSRADTAALLTSRLKLLADLIDRAGALIVTLGTAWIYELREQPGYIVANCHKFPSDTFTRRRLTPEEIAARWIPLAARLHKRNPQLRIIFTISPIRHLKDGFEGNALSKAILHLACDRLCQSIPAAEYFPSYEILTDDLRDYRYYAADLTHPSEEAVEYIWEKFQERYLTDAARTLLREGEKVMKALSHRPIIACDIPEIRSRAEDFRRQAEERYLDFIRRHPDMGIVPDTSAPGVIIHNSMPVCEKK